MDFFRGIYRNQLTSSLWTSECGSFLKTYRNIRFPVVLGKLSDYINFRIKQQVWGTFIYWILIVLLWLSIIFIIFLIFTVLAECTHQEKKANQTQQQNVNALCVTKCDVKYTEKSKMGFWSCGAPQPYSSAGGKWKWSLSLLVVNQRFSACLGGIFLLYINTPRLYKKSQWVSHQLHKYFPLLHCKVPVSELLCMSVKCKSHFPFKYLT